MWNRPFQEDSGDQSVQVHGTGKGFPYAGKLIRIGSEESHPVLAEQNLGNIPQGECYPAFEKTASPTRSGPVHRLE